tara:strand:- start:333 stop:527 length:195 start_codon:yes stop_codon:yes gene_type:complete
METTKFIKNGKELNEKDYDFKGDMIADCDYMQTDKLMTKQEVLDKYKDTLSTEQIKLLTKSNGL